MLTVQMIPQSGLFMVIPVIGSRECAETEFMFDEEEQAAEFVRHYFLNPYAAMFAYYQQNAPSTFKENFI